MEKYSIRIVDPACQYRYDLYFIVHSALHFILVIDFLVRLLLAGCDKQLQDGVK